MSYDFDYIVIGAGPGGYVSAIKAAQLGKKVAIIEKRSTPGGTCLNVGCIPSKALLDSSEHYHQAKEKFAIHGIKTGELSIDFPQMMKRKDDVVSSTVSGINYLFDKNKITSITGSASFVDAHTLQVEGQENQTVTGEVIVIATGSSPIELPFMKYDGQHVISSDHALFLEKIPEEMVVVGGGVIGLELGSVYARLGTKVTVIEFCDSIIPTMDIELGKTLQRSLKKLGFTFKLSSKVKSHVVKDGKVIVTAEDKKGKDFEVSADHVLVSVGRRPHTDKLNIEAAGIEADERGFIKVDSSYKTSASGVYAIGDVIGGVMLAHKAEEEGVIVAENICGHHAKLNYNTIPGVVYTWPEVASCGKTEKELKEAGVAYKVGKFPFKASGRARASEESDGFVKVLACEKYDEILGVHMIGPRCADLIQEAVVAMEYKASAQDIGMMTHGHPTFTEAFKEAAMMAWNGQPLHI